MIQNIIRIHMNLILKDGLNQINMKKIISLSHLALVFDININ
jgi:hypothetical protein